LPSSAITFATSQSHYESSVNCDPEDVAKTCPPAVLVSGKVSVFVAAQFELTSHGLGGKIHDQEAKGLRVGTSSLRTNTEGRSTGVRRDSGDLVATRTDSTDEESIVGTRRRDQWRPTRRPAKCGKAPRGWEPKRMTRSWSGYLLLVSRKLGALESVKSTTSSPVAVLISWCRVNTSTPVTS